MFFLIISPGPGLQKCHNCMTFGRSRLTICAGVETWGIPMDSNLHKQWSYGAPTTMVQYISYRFHNMQYSYAYSYEEHILWLVT